MEVVVAATTEVERNDEKKTGEKLADNEKVSRWENMEWARSKRFLFC